MSHVRTAAFSENQEAGWAGLWMRAGPGLRAGGQPQFTWKSPTRAAPAEWAGCPPLKAGKTRSDPVCGGTRFISGEEEMLAGASVGVKGLSPAPPRRSKRRRDVGTALAAKPTGTVCRDGPVPQACGRGGACSSPRMSRPRKRRSVLRGGAAGPGAAGGL